MAARTGASVGVAVTITILGALGLGLFVTTMVFYGKSQKALSDLKTTNEDNARFVSPSERDNAVVRSITDEAQSERMSAMGFLIKNRRQLLEATAGDPDMSIAEFKLLISAIEGAEGSSLADLIANKNTVIELLNKQLAVSDAERSAAQKESRDQAERVAAIEGEFNMSSEDRQREVQGMRGHVMVLENKITELEGKYGSNIEEVRADTTTKLNEMQAELDRVNEDNTSLRYTVAELRGEGRANRTRPLNEEALVDGSVTQINIVDNEVLISIGRQHKAILGMTFAIYDSPTDIRQNELTDEYQIGKAVIEIIRVEEGFSRARIIESSQGNPIVRGDVIANAVYDPNKTYKFVVDGLFDTNGNGVATFFEREELEALIERWGGKLVDDIDGDVDFVVLGERPVLPPQPRIGAPVAVIKEYNRLQHEIRRYDDLMNGAEATSIPLLNSNRLQTLIGAFPN
ncbi:MAG: hypothetical protein JKY96_04030 [Phycisphaerales bacterium]|nr:hypothetical protein [Phycisphaerales bacterium]